MQAILERIDAVTIARLHVKYNVSQFNDQLSASRSHIFTDVEAMINVHDSPSRQLWQGHFLDGMI